MPCRSLIRTYFGRYKDGPLESPFSGNLIDLCPTGVYTDKPSRFTGRRWDFERGPSLCIHCSLGCNTIASARYRGIVRLEARFNESVNGHFICDRGRYGFYYTNHPERPRHARIGTEEVSLTKALQTAAEKLLQIQQKKGPESIVSVGSTRSSLENQAMLLRFCEAQGWNEPNYFETPAMAHKVRRAVLRLDERLAVSMRKMEKADFILVVGADPVNEAPMLALAIRQAFRNGATVTLMDPRPVFLPLKFEHLSVAPDDLEPCLATLVKGTVNRPAAEKLGKEALQFYDALPSEYPHDPTLKDRMATATEKLRQSRYPVIVCGTAIVSESTPDMVADSTLLLHAAKERAGLFYLMPEANAFGAALLSSGQDSLMDVIEAMEKENVKALILVENDPFWSFPDQERLRQAMNKLDLLLVMDYLPSTATQLAHIFLPTRTLFEMETTFVNQEGRVQSAPAAYCGGIPISQISDGSHPPRVFRRDIPGGDPEPAWEILFKLANTIRSSEEERFPRSRGELWAWLTKKYPAFIQVQSPGERQDGIRVVLGREKGNPFSTYRQTQSEKEHRQEGTLDLLLVDWTFGTEELSAYSKYIQQVEENPCLFMHPGDASRVGVADQDRCILHFDGGPLEVELRIVKEMAPGVIAMPKHRQLTWRRLRSWPPKVRVDQIEKHSL